MDTLLSIIPAKWLPVLPVLLLVLKVCDEIVRAIPDKWLAAHSTVQALTNGVKWLWSKLSGVKVPGAALVLLAVGLTGCAHPWPALSAAAQSGRVAVATFEQWDAAHKRALLAAHPECRAQPKPDLCFAAVLSPYEVERDEVLRPIEALTPVLVEAESLAVQANADRKVTDALAAKVGGLVARVLAAIATLRGAP